MNARGVTDSALVRLIDRGNAKAMGLNFEEGGLYWKIFFYCLDSGKPWPSNDEEAAKFWATDIRRYRRLMDKILAAGAMRKTEDGIVNTAILEMLAARKTRHLLFEGDPLAKNLKAIKRGRKAISSALRSRVLKRDGFTCLECGSQDELTCDHILAVAHGGDTTFENLRTLCAACNMKKGASLEVEA